jgi:ankyrin repeat protein
VLNYAISCEADEIVEYLLDHGADINFPNKVGVRACVYAGTQHNDL